MTAKERQQKFTEAQAKLGRRKWGVFVTDDERFYLERVLLQLRNNPEQVPAMMRDTRTGRVVELEL